MNKHCHQLSETCSRRHLFLYVMEPVLDSVLNHFSSVDVHSIKHFQNIYYCSNEQTLKIKMEILCLVIRSVQQQMIFMLHWGVSEQHLSACEQHICRHIWIEVVDMNLDQTKILVSHKRFFYNIIKTLLVYHLELQHLQYVFRNI